MASSTPGEPFTSSIEVQLHDARCNLQTLRGETVKCVEGYENAHQQLHFWQTEHDDIKNVVGILHSVALFNAFRARITKSKNQMGAWESKAAVLIERKNEIKRQVWHTPKEMSL